MHRYHRFTVYNVCKYTIYHYIYIHIPIQILYIYHIYIYIYHIAIRCIRCFHSADDLQVSQEFNAPASQLLALFNKASGGTVRQGADKWWLIISDHLVCVYTLLYYIIISIYSIFIYYIYDM